MVFRLVGRCQDREIETYLDLDRTLLGSGEECDIRLEHPTVSRAHAELRMGSALEIVDLGSRNGTFVDTVRVLRETVGPGSTIRLGDVTLRLEAVDEADREPAIALELPTPEPITPIGRGPDQPTVDLNPYEEFCKQTLPRALRLTATGREPVEICQVIGTGLHDALAGIAPVVEIGAVSGGDRGVLFSTRPAGGSTPGSGIVERSAGGLSLTVDFTTHRAAEVFQPLVDAALSLLVLALDRRADPPPPAKLHPPPQPDPASVVPEVGRIYAEAARVARTDVGALICGESGTGKEVLARYLHRASGRSDQPFVALNCAALPRDLLESELFGIEKGVATGVEQRSGKFELADGGTLFLDEIGDMALPTQAMILRVLQEHEVYRVGAARPRKVDVRIVAATNKDIHAMVEAGGFRQDLYYRIATWVVDLPPLRRRRADIPNLAAHFLAREASRQGRSVAGVSRAALDAMLAYDWPGNIRQLENEMARAVAFVAPRGLLDRTRLSADIVTGPQGSAEASLADRLRAVERREIVRCLRLFDGDTAAAAEALGLPRSTLYRRMKVLEIET